MEIIIWIKNGSAFCFFPRKKYFIIIAFNMSHMLCIITLFN